MPRRWKIFLVIAFVSLIADQVTKYWARESLPTAPYGKATAACVIPDDLAARPPKCRGVDKWVIGENVGWRLSFNPGSAFGLFHSQSGARVFLSIVGVLAVFGMLWMLKKAREDQRALIWALGLVAGGAVGNLIDRIYYGVVTDFALLKYGSKEWPVFNVADVALVVGVGLMFVDIFGEAKREKAEKAEQEKQKAEEAKAKGKLKAKAKAAEGDDAA